MNLKILILPGDGIGVEVTSAAVEVPHAVAKKFGHTLELSDGLIGGMPSIRPARRSRRKPHKARWRPMPR